MTTDTKTISNRDVHEIVKRYVERSQQPGQRLKVVDQAVVHADRGVPAGDDRWYVQVEPESGEGDHYAWFAEHVSRISEQIEKEQGIIVDIGTRLPPLWL